MAVPDPPANVDALDLAFDLPSSDLPDVTVAPDPPADVDGPDPPPGHAAPVPPSMNSGNMHHVTAYHDPQLTNLGVEISCAQCHGQDGTGGQDAAGRAVGGIRGLSADILAAHAQGNSDHPAPTGRADVRFPDITAEDFDAIAAFLSSE